MSSATERCAEHALEGAESVAHNKRQCEGAHSSDTTLAPSTRDAPTIFSLPRELRDIIYDRLWKQIAQVRQQHCGRVYAVSYRSPRAGVLSGKAAWLLASEQMFSEELEQHVQHMVWHFDCLPTPITGRKSVAPTNPVIVPGKARGYQLRLAKLTFIDWTGGDYFLTSDYGRRIGDIHALWATDSPLTSIHVDMSRTDDEDVISKASLSRHCKIDSELTILKQLTAYSQLKKLTFVLREGFITQYTFTLPQRWENEGLRPGFDPKRCSMESFAKEVFRIGRLLVSNGTEKMMPFEQYWAQYVEADRIGGVTCWKYTIEKWKVFHVASKQ